MHTQPENRHALFQAASQFNLLEMTSQSVTPEMGVGIYEYDRTQGPACAIACGAGTIYRNYFTEVNGGIGQTQNRQIDCLEDIGRLLRNEELALWEMKNGYALMNETAFQHINPILSMKDESERKRLKQALRIGLQWDTEVTLNGGEHIVSQAYCSALPVSYSSIPAYLWEYFARLVLEATYEATLLAALINLEKTGCNKVFLTLVGGGAFGNAMDWIIDSIDLSLKRFKLTPLDVKIVSYGSSKSQVKTLVETFGSKE